MTKEEIDEEIELLQKELQFLDGQPNAVERFFWEWFDSNLEFAIVDIAEGTKTPMEVVHSDVVLEKYDQYLAEQRADIKQEIEELLNSGTGSEEP